MSAQRQLGILQALGSQLYSAAAAPPELVDVAPSLGADGGAA